MISPSRPVNRGWRLDDAAYEDAIAFLGLTLPVRIKQTGHRGGRFGAHRLRIDPATGTPYHHITIKSWLSVNDAGGTVWHELTHAMQAERAAAMAGAVTAAEWLTAWRATDERAGSYAVRPIEVEARAFEEFNHELPLAVPA